MLFISTYISAQTYVSGVVYDQQNEPVAFANVLFKDSSEGVISDIDGHFVLESENNYSFIVVSYVGFETNEIKLQNNKTLKLDVFLKTGFELEEVLIVDRPKKRLKKSSAGSAGNRLWVPYKHTQSDIRASDYDSHTPWRAWRHGGGCIYIHIYLRVKVVVIPSY